MVKFVARDHLAVASHPITLSTPTAASGPSTASQFVIRLASLAIVTAPGSRQGLFSLVCSNFVDIVYDFSLLPNAALTGLRGGHDYTGCTARSHGMAQSSSDSRIVRSLGATSSPGAMVALGCAARKAASPRVSRREGRLLALISMG